MSIGNGTNNPNIQSDYRGFTQTRNDNTLNTQITYQSTKEKLQSAMTSTYKVGTNDANYGRIDSLKLNQANGPFWQLVVEYNQPLSAGVIITTGTNDKKATQNSLTVRMVSMPIESHPNYKYIWNHSLASCYGSNQIDFAEISGLNAQQAQDFLSGHIDEDGICHVKWIQNDSQLPAEPMEVVDGEQTYKQPWKVNYYMTKPGVTSYDFPTYTIVQNARHKSRQNAAWSIAVKNGKLKFPTYGDFGLQSKFFSGDASATPPKYHWLCLGGGVNFDGKYWIANCSYEWSPDPNGWDQEIYEVASDGYDKNNNNPILS